jgi:LacI family transcriptional regulator, galactose operon repressor
MTVTLKELGRLAGVHPSTVARVLNGDPRQRVSTEVRQQILTLAHDRGYQPNVVARSLRTKRSSVVGTLIPDISNPFFALMFRGIEDALAERDISVILANTDDDSVREARGISMMRGRQVDGLILATARRHDPFIDQLTAEHLPFVLVNRHTDPITPTVVVPADYTGSIAAVEYLIGLGHRRIAHIAGSDEMSTGHARRSGYRDALDRHGLAFDATLLVEGSYREQGGYDAMRQLLALDEPPTAVFAVNDLAAAGAVRAIHESNWRVPRDISIIGFNDLSTAVQLTPRLTTMQLPLYEMGAKAGARLLDQLLDERPPTAPEIVAVSLVERDSTAPPSPLRPTLRLGADRSP